MLKEKVTSAVYKLYELLPHPVSVLDVGCREGYSVKYLKNLGYDVTAIEIDKKWVRKGIIHGDFLTYEFEQTFDIIFSRHSIEHCGSGFFDRASMLLDGGGILFCIFPLVQWAVLNRGLDDEKDTLPVDVAMEDFRMTSPFKELQFSQTEEFGIKRMDDDFIYIGINCG